MQFFVPRRLELWTRFARTRSRCTAQSCPYIRIFYRMGFASTTEQEADRPILHLISKYNTCALTNFWGMPDSRRLTALWVPNIAQGDASLVLQLHTPRAYIAS